MLTHILTKTQKVEKQLASSYWQMADDGKNRWQPDGNPMAPDGNPMAIRWHPMATRWHPMATRWQPDGNPALQPCQPDVNKGQFVAKTYICFAKPKM